jgi:hypothetical protein
MFVLLLEVAAALPGTPESAVSTKVIPQNANPLLQVSKADRAMGEKKE